jgi:hypothetical protein
VATQLLRKVKQEFQEKNKGEAKATRTKKMIEAFRQELSQRFANLLPVVPIGRVLFKCTKAQKIPVSAPNFYGYDGDAKPQFGEAMSEEEALAHFLESRDAPSFPRDLAKYARELGKIQSHGLAGSSEQRAMVQDFEDRFNFFNGQQKRADSGDAAAKKLLKDLAPINSVKNQWDLLQSCLESEVTSCALAQSKGDATMQGVHAYLGPATGLRTGRLLSMDADPPCATAACVTDTTHSVPTRSEGTVTQAAKADPPGMATGLNSGIDPDAAFLDDFLLDPCLDIPTGDVCSLSDLILPISVTKLPLLDMNMVANGLVLGEVMEQKPGADPPGFGWNFQSDDDVIAVALLEAAFDESPSVQSIETVEDDWSCTPADAAFPFVPDEVFVKHTTISESSFGSGEDPSSDYTDQSGDNESHTDDATPSSDAATTDRRDNSGGCLGYSANFQSNTLSKEMPEGHDASVQQLTIAVGDSTDGGDYSATNFVNLDLNLHSKEGNEGSAPSVEQRTTTPEDSSILEGNAVVARADTSGTSAFFASELNGYRTKISNLQTKMDRFTALVSFFDEQAHWADEEEDECATILLNDLNPKRALEKQWALLHQGYAFSKEIPYESSASNVLDSPGQCAALRRYEGHWAAPQNRDWLKGCEDCDSSPDECILRDSPDFSNFEDENGDIQEAQVSSKLSFSNEDDCRKLPDGWGSDDESCAPIHTDPPELEKEGCFGIQFPSIERTADDVTLPEMEVILDSQPSQRIGPVALLPGAFPISGMGLADHENEEALVLELPTFAGGGVSSDAQPSAYSTISNPSTFMTTQAVVMTLPRAALVSDAVVSVHRRLLPCPLRALRLLVQALGPRRRRRRHRGSKALAEPSLDLVDDIPFAVPIVTWGPDSRGETRVSFLDESQDLPSETRRLEESAQSGILYGLRRNTLSLEA